MLTKEKALQVKPLLENEEFCKELMNEATDEAQCKVFLKHGVSVDAEDLKEIANAIDSSVPEEDDELSENDLENVAGGFAGTLIVVAGIAIVVGLILLAYVLSEIKKGTSQAAIAKAVQKKMKR